MSQREEIPMTVEWIRAQRDRRHQRNQGRPREVVWKEDDEAARQAAAELGISVVTGPGERNPETDTMKTTV